MSRAMERYKEDKERRSRQFQARQEALFREIPRLGEIDRELRSTMSQIARRTAR